MKIVFITRNYPPTLCGVGDHTYYLANELLKMGMEVHVLCSGEQTTTFSNGIVIHPIVQQWDRRGARLIRDKMGIIQPDWVVVQYVPHGFDDRGLPMMIPYLYRQIQQQGFKIFTIFHEIRLRPGQSLWSLFSSKVQSYLAKRICAMSTKVVTSIDFYAQILRGYRQDISLIPIGSNILPVETSALVQHTLRNRHNIPADAQVVGTFGNRDVSDYLDDFDLLAHRNPNFLWLICGKNNTPTDVLARRPYIRNLGEMSASDIFQHMTLADVFFMPDLVSVTGEGGTSNKSGSLAFAYSLGIPIVGIKGDLNNALLEQEYNILLADMNKKNGIYDAIKNCFDSDTLRQELSRGAVQLYNRALRWEVIAKKIASEFGVEGVKNVKVGA